MRVQRELESQITNYAGTLPVGFHLWVSRGGKEGLDWRWGKTWPIYDLASLTKVIFTTTAYMRAYQDHGLSLAAPVSKYLPTKSKIPLRSFLNHTSGMTWWLALYQEVDLASPVSWRQEQVKKIVLGRIRHQSGNKSVYSDLNFLVLGWVLEEFYSSSLHNIFLSLVEDGWIPPGFHFCPEGEPLSHPKSFYAPTERCPWRKRLLVAEVHDENTWALGGVGPQAGLFGSMKDVKELVLMWRDVLLGRGKGTPLKRETLKRFTSRSLPRSRGDFGLGFVLPTRGAASCGQYMSDTAWGHTGFTGTSLWLDVRRDQMAILLSNRVFPRRDRVDFKRLRPWLHDLALARVGRLRTQRGVRV